MSMTRWGFWIALFGALHFVLPQFGVQHLAFVWLCDAATPVAAAMVVLGLVLLVVGLVRRRPASAPPAP